MRILITAGPTREYLDSVRFLSNPSTGKMGVALARAAARRGHRVTLVLGPVALSPPRGVTTIHVTTAAEMLAAARQAFRACDAALFTAAVCDYRPVRRHAKKLTKHTHRWQLELEPTADIAATLGRRKGRRTTICFALEDHAGRAHAEGKMRRKHADAIVLNGPANIGADRGTVEFLPRGGAWQRWPAARKAALAGRIVRELTRLHGSAKTRAPTSG